MKKTIGVLVLVVTVIALLLYACGDPSSPIQPDTEPVTSEAQTPSGVSVDEPSSANPVVGNQEPASVPAPPGPRSSGPSAATTQPVERPVRTETGPVMVPQPATSLPVPTISALLAVHPRDLEGGSGSAVLIPTDSLRAELRISIPQREWLPTDFPQGQPASTINTPTAYGQRFGDVFAGLAYQERIRYDDWNDGIASFGVGLGNPTRYVGLDAAVNILDTYTDIGEDRSLSLKVHRRLPFRTAIAVGHENIWHTDGTDGGSSQYVVVSKIVLLRDQPTGTLGSLVMNVGLGTDRFLSEERFAAGDDGLNPFGSLAIRVLPPVNAIANWTGQDLALGISVAPVRTWPLVITPAVVDVTGRAGDGARFSMSAGLSYRFDR